LVKQFIANQVWSLSLNEFCGNNELYSIRLNKFSERLKIHGLVCRGGGVF
jgi:hypothetical protein